MIWKINGPYIYISVNGRLIHVMRYLMYLIINIILYKQRSTNKIILCNIKKVPLQTSINRKSQPRKEKKNS